jgi:hypothetical protein
MRGPAGWLWDVVWYNFFGKNYVDLIGKQRLAGAGWEKVQEVGDGLACYATEKIDSSHSRKRRDKIVSSLEEFFWTPGCKREEKRAPIFDFSEQLATLSPEMRVRVSEQSKPNRFIFAGLSEEEKKQAIRKIEDATGRK